jgi:hypothetical protein
VGFTIVLYCGYCGKKTQGPNSKPPARLNVVRAGKFQGAF